MWQLFVNLYESWMENFKENPDKLSEIFQLSLKKKSTGLFTQVSHLNKNVNKCAFVWKPDWGRWAVMLWCHTNRLLFQLHLNSTDSFFLPHTPTPWCSSNTLPVQMRFPPAPMWIWWAACLRRRVSGALIRRLCCRWRAVTPAGEPASLDFHDKTMAGAPTDASSSSSPFISFSSPSRLSSSCWNNVKICNSGGRNSLISCCVGSRRLCN